METAALVAAIVSIIIGGFAIWLSVTFYRMSNKISEDTKEAAKGISASVNRLESLFDSLYSDTFSMMKDTVTDMRKHMWPDKEKTAEEQKQIEEKANVQIDELKKQISDELSDMIREKVGRTDKKITEVEQNIERLVERAIQGTRKVESEAYEERYIRALSNMIWKYLERLDSVSVGEIVDKFIIIFPKNAIIDALKFLINRAPITANGDLENPYTILETH